MLVMASYGPHVVNLDSRCDSLHAWPSVPWVNKCSHRYVFGFLTGLSNFWVMGASV